MKVIHWFRQDLRLSDNPALSHAAFHGDVLPIYILDDTHSGVWKMGGASRVYLHHSLKALNESLEGKLLVLAGDPLKLIPELVENYGIDKVVWNRCYEPWRIQRDKQLKQNLQALDVDVESFNGSLLWEPWTVAKKDGTPYKVYTPYYKKGCLLKEPPRMPEPAAKSIKLIAHKSKATLEKLELLPTIDWDKPINDYWQAGEEGAKNRLAEFLQDGISEYKEGRDFPAIKKVSELSPSLHFGEVSPNQVWYAASHSPVANASAENLEHFHKELAWREFSYYLLYHFPVLPEKNFQAKFDAFPWQNDSEKLAAWQKGMTGYPLVDAGMRQLWQTGYMHNRVRMVVGSFLVKNLLTHWRKGEDWFWDCLVDADLASNAASWQWVAGSGADAAPYFRIFNPITQSEKFDAEGEYIRQYVPELAKLPKKWIHKPWQAPSEVLEKAGVVIGKDYPEPIVDVKLSREQALEAFATTKKN